MCTIWRQRWRRRTSRNWNVKYDGKGPLNRRHIHELALQRDRETVVRQSKLRAAGLIAPPQTPIHDRIGNRLHNRLGEQPNNKSMFPNLFKGRHDEREGGSCNCCGQRGHPVEDCNNPPMERYAEECFLAPSKEDKPKTKRLQPVLTPSITRVISQEYYFTPVPIHWTCALQSDRYAMNCK